MKKKRLYVLLAASIALNAGFIAAGAVQYVSRHHARHPDLGLAPQVRREFEANFREFRRELKPLRARLADDRESMLDLVESSDPSADALQRQEKAILQDQQALIRLFASHLIRQKKLLTPEQQKAFFDHLKTHVAGRRERSGDGGKTH